MSDDCTPQSKTGDRSRHESTEDNDVCPVCQEVALDTNMRGYLKCYSCGWSA